MAHGVVVGISQSLQHWTEGATYIRRCGHHVGIGPHSNFFLSFFLAKSRPSQIGCLPHMVWP